MTATEKTRGQEPPPPPPLDVIVNQAAAAAAASEEDESEHPPQYHHDHQDHQDHNDHHGHHEHHRRSSIHNFADIEVVPPPAYNGAEYGQLEISQNGMDTGARVAEDGRVNIKIDQKTRKLSNLLVPALRTQLHLQELATHVPSYVPPGLGGEDGIPPPPMNLVIQIVGSRGDVQPFIALGKVLKEKYGHRVRIATHPVFRDFVNENGLEFFSIGGDPSELMAFMVKNPGLMPGMDSLKNGDVGKRRKGIYEMITGCWRSCIEAGDGTGVEASDDLLDGAASFDNAIGFDSNPTLKPFVADAIIANPPSFAHVHIAEKLGIPLHIMFTMPWSPTQAFPHPLANILSSNADSSMTNFVSYALIDMMTWQGLGDVINRFREKSLGLEPVSIMWAPGMTSRLRIPHTYCWSPALIPKPRDWGSYIDISGFYFLNLASNYTPEPELAAFLAAGPPPVYIGFGSIVVDDPNAMTKMIFDTVRKTGQRTLVSKGWGGFGADQIGIPDGVFMLGNVPHDWLFKHVSCVVHHGGAGTTAAGISAGRPTVVVPFFGDQPFWGAMTARAGAGPLPVPYKTITADKLAAAIMEALKPESLERAAELSAKISQENGAESGAESFHKQLHLEDLRCSMYPQHVAVWRVKRTDLRLSALAATILGNEGLLSFNDLKLYRPREYETEDGPWDPISGGAAALIGTIGNLTMGVADFPVEVLKSLRVASSDVRQDLKKDKDSPPMSQTPTSTSARASTSSVNLSSSHTPRPSVSEHPSQESTHSDETLTSTISQITARDDVTPPSPSQAPTVIPSTVPSRKETLSPDSHGSHGSHPHRRISASRPADAFSHVTLEGVIGTSRGVSRIVGAGMKSPMDFTMGLAKGFHNAPKLYGDKTVRKSDKITGLHSGFKAAGKEFGFGFYDGITGLVTQPMAGAKEEGAAGFIKGAARGIGGLILKPGAGIWGLPGYTFKGIYAELQKMFGSSVQNYIIAARTAQGYEEWKGSTTEQRETVVANWKNIQVELRKAGRKYGKEKEEELAAQRTHSRHGSTDNLNLFGLNSTRHMSWDERKKLAEEKKKLKEEKKIKKSHKDKESGGKIKSRCKYCPFHHEEGFHHSAMENIQSPSTGTLQSPSMGSLQNQSTGSLNHAATFPGATPPVRTEAPGEFEDAIQRSITATSRGNPEEDAMIERALRASVVELQKARAESDEKEAYERAVAASVAEAGRTRAEANHGDRKMTIAQESGVTDEEHEAELALALKKSLTEYTSVHSQENLHVQHHNVHLDQEGHEWSSDSGLGTDDDEEFKRTLEESKRLHDESRSKIKLADHKAIGQSEEELARAITESEKAHKAQTDELVRQKTEEDIVMEYVKKQSLLEEQHKQKLQNGSNEVY